MARLDGLRILTWSGFNRLQLVKISLTCLSADKFVANKFYANSHKITQLSIADYLNKTKY